ncbi:unnamed protein product [Parajaminaea phylloscopi]
MVGPSSSRANRTNGTGPGAAAPPSSGGSKATPISLAFDYNLRTSLAHLPPSVHTALTARDIPPQNIVLQLTRINGHHDEPNSKAGSSTEVDDAAEARRDTVFLGWSGHSSNVDSTLVLSASMAGLFYPEASASETYTLTLLRSPPLPTASRVNLTPLTPDDWEILSQNAGAVEDDMLSQVRSVSTAGRVCIFAGRGGSQKCWFNVDSTDPPTAASNLVPGASKGKASERPPARAVRLTTATEIVIAPRTRLSAAQAAANETHSISGSKSSAAPGLVDGAVAARDRARNRLYKVLPTGWAPLEPSLSAETLKDNPLIVVPFSDAGEDDVPHSDDDWQLLSRAFGPPSAKQDCLRVTITVQPCPAAQALRPRPEKADQLGGDQSEASRSDSGDSSSGSTPSRPTTTAWLLKGSPQLTSFLSDGSGSSDHTAWPKRWVWLNAVLRDKLGGLGAGETICFSAPPPASKTVAPPQLLSGVPSTSSIERPPVASLAGSDTLLSTLRRQVQGSSLAFSGASKPASSNILLHGPSGIGKTRILRTLSAQLRHGLTTTLYVDCTSLSEMRISQLKTTFKEWRNALDWYGQSSTSEDFAGGAVLMLDNLDRVLIAEVENVDPTRARTLAECFVETLLVGTPDGSSSGSSDTVILATASSSLSLHKLLAEKHAWRESIGIKPPGKAERAEILAALVATKASSANGRPDAAAAATTASSGIVADPSLNYVLLSALTEGYLPADLVDLVERAIYRAAVRMSGSEGSSDAGDSEGQGKQSSQTSDAAPTALVLGSQDFKAAQENFTPLSLRSLSLSSSGSVSWSSIGGLQETRRVLRETLEFPSRYAQIFASCPLRLRSGLLLYGYPGCGKTMLASAVAKECGANFVSVKGPEILNKYIGASEKSVRDLFERASAAKPCVLFFDEFDSIAPKRGHDSTGVTDRVVNQLLTQMDGAEGLSGVYVLAATSRPDLIDSALLRPGRLDKSLLCDMPSKEDRLDILAAVVREGNIHIDTDSVKWEEWADKTEGFSGADLQALVYNAHLEVVHEGISTDQAGAGAGGTANGTSSSEKDDKALQFIEVKGSQSAELRRSGAEEQALRRRLELALANSKAGRRGKGKQQQQQQQQSSKAQGGADGTSHDDDNSGSSPGGPKRRLITSAHLARSLSSMRPSVPAAERQRLQRIYQEFAGSSNAEVSKGAAAKGRGADFPSGEGSREVGARQSLM